MFVHILIIIFSIFILIIPIQAEMDGFNKTSYQELMTQDKTTNTFTIEKSTVYKVADKSKKKDNKKLKKKRQKRKSKKKGKQILSFTEMTLMLSNRR